MRPRLRGEASSPEPSTPVDRLWRSIGDLFYDDTGYHPGPDVGFDGLSPGDVERLWAHLESRSTSIPDEPISWTPHDCAYQPLKLPEAVRLVLDGRIENIALRLRDLCSEGESLPDLFVELWADYFNLYWWTGHPEDDWTPTKVAALVVLLAELRDLVSHAQPDYEWPDDPPGFWDIVQNYRTGLARGRRAGDPGRLRR